MRAWFPLIFAGLLAGCSGSDSPDGGAVADSGVIEDAGLEPDSGVPPDTGVQELDAGEVDAGTLPGTWTEVQVVLRADCSPCHDPNNMNDRTVVRQYDRIVNQLSGRYPLVVPGDPEASFLYAKVNNETNAYCARQMPTGRDCGRVMPPGPTRRPLEPEEVELIRSWIEAGALEN